MASKTVLRKSLNLVRRLRITKTFPRRARRGYRAKDTVVIKGAVVIYRSKKSHVKKGNSKVIRRQAHCNRRNVIIFLVVVFFFVVNNDY